ncbi:MAG: caspase family protein [Spirochaetaceae bacterium]|nr:caspase family protein [Spirochaetaceae bacterium]
MTAHKPNMAFFLFFLIFLPLVLPAQTRPRNAQNARFALVVGNAGYRYINPLTNTAKDARDLAAALTGLGYQVDLRLDVTAQDFVRAVIAYTEKLAANPQSEGFFWFTGHGSQVQHGFQRGKP